MLSIARITAVLVGAVLVTSPMMVFAQSDTEPGALVGPNAPTMQTQSTETSATKQTREARSAERKEKLKTKLDAAQKKRIEDRCVASQGKITALKAKVQGYDKGYVTRYDTLLGKLSDVSVKLKANNLDTTKLDASVSELTGKVAAFNTDVDAYQQTIDDLATMDCKADPVAFKAAIETSRTQLTALRAQVGAIRALLKDTVRPELQALRTQLKTTETTETTDATE